MLYRNRGAMDRRELPFFFSLRRPWLWQQRDDLLSLRSEFDSWSVHLRFVVDKLTLDRNFLSLLQFSPVIVVAGMFHTLLLYRNITLVSWTNEPSLGTNGAVVSRVSGRKRIGQKSIFVTLCWSKCCSSWQKFYVTLYAWDFSTNYSLRQLITDKLHSFSINAVAVLPLGSRSSGHRRSPNLYTSPRAAGASVGGMSERPVTALGPRGNVSKD